MTPNSLQICSANAYLTTKLSSDASIPFVLLDSPYHLIVASDMKSEVSEKSRPLTSSTGRYDLKDLRWYNCLVPSTKPSVVTGTILVKRGEVYAV